MKNILGKILSGALENPDTETTPSTIDTENPNSLVSKLLGGVIGKPTFYGWLHNPEIEPDEKIN